MLYHVLVTNLKSHKVLQCVASEDQLKRIEPLDHVQVVFIREYHGPIPEEGLGSQLNVKENVQ